MHARNTRHGRHRAIHGHARLIHEKRPRLRARLLDQLAGHIQRPARAARPDPARQRLARRAHGASGQQVRLGGRASRVQRPGPNARPTVQLHVHGGLRQAQGQRARHLLRSRSPDQQEDTREQKEQQAPQAQNVPHTLGPHSRYCR